VLFIWPEQLRDEVALGPALRGAFIANATPFVLFLFGTPVKRSAGIAGKNSSWNSGFGQRLRFASSHRIPSSTIGSRAGCSGWKIRQRTSLAVQQQRFDKRQQC
jgi:hypothetical protein